MPEWKGTEAQAGSEEGCLESFTIMILGIRTNLGLLGLFARCKQLGTVESPGVSSCVWIKMRRPPLERSAQVKTLLDAVVSHLTDSFDLNGMQNEELRVVFL